MDARDPTQPDPGRPAGTGPAGIVEPPARSRVGDGARPWREPVAGFVFDLVFALVVVLAVSLAGAVVWALLAALSLALQGGAALGDTAALTAQIGQPGLLVQVAIAVVPIAAATLWLYFWRRRASATERAASTRAARQPATWAWTALAGVATFAFSVTAMALGRSAGIEQTPSNLPMLEAVGGAHPWVLLLFVVLLAPAYEELLFRRVLFGRLWAAGRPWLGVLLSSVVFALMHELPGLSGNDWAATGLLWASYGAMGAVFAAVYWRTGTLWAPIGAHALNNLLACSALLVGPGFAGAG